nr:unnamed protein product [Spirometra erinaceieuropaei]
MGRRINYSKRRTSIKRLPANASASFNLPPGNRIFTTIGLQRRLLGPLSKAGVSSDKVTWGRQPTTPEKRGGADRKPRDRRDTLSHRHTPEADNTTLAQQRPTTPPSDEGEADKPAG